MIFFFRMRENYFKKNRIGYYDDEDVSWIRFSSQDLNAFVLTERGLLLVFQNYTVSGYDDVPITLLIPYDKIAVIAKQDCPLLDLAISKNHPDG